MGGKEKIEGKKGDKDTDSDEEESAPKKMVRKNWRKEEEGCDLMKTVTARMVMTVHRQPQTSQAFCLQSTKA